MARSGVGLTARLGCATILTNPATVRCQQRC
nr:MAG TPA: hypothetical protein [Caudoviricetes sp.]